MARIFISYSRKDEKFVHRLAADLDRLGAEIWLDTKDIPAGMKWSSAIQEGLDKTEVMLLIISPDSMASRHVEDEWNYFQDRGRPIIPLSYRPAKPHFQLQRVQYIDFTAQKYPLAELVEELRRYGVNLHEPRQEARQATPPTPAAPAPEPAKKSSSGLVAAGVFIVLIVAGLIFAPQLMASLQAPAVTPTTTPLAIDPISAQVVGNIQLCVDGTGTPQSKVNVTMLDAVHTVIHNVETFVSERGRWKAWLIVPAQPDGSGTITVQQGDAETSLPVHLGDKFTPGAAPFGPWQEETVDQCSTTGTEALGE